MVMPEKQSSIFPKRSPILFYQNCIKPQLIGALFQNKQMDDTSALDYKEGKDMQGIPWERLNYSRNQYREMRLRQYKNYENLTMPRDGLQKVRFLCFST